MFTAFYMNNFGFKLYLGIKSNLVIRQNLRLSTNLGSLNWRELSPQVTEGATITCRLCNSCNLHNALRVQELLYGLKQSFID